MKFLTFLLKNLLRNRTRSLLTGLSIALAVFILCVILTMLAALNRINAGGGAAASHLVLQEKYAFPSILPVAYVDKIRALPGVKTACPFQWWIARGPVDSDPPIIGPAVDANTVEPFLDNLMGHAQTPEMLARFKQDKQGILIGIKWHERYGWTVGQTITLTGSTIPVAMEFHVAGYLVEGSLDDNFIFRYDYLTDTLEGRGMERYSGNVAAIYIEPVAGKAPEALQPEVDALFASGPVFTRTESEAAVLASFAASAGALVGLIAVFGIAASLTLFLVVANAISMSIRERTLEIGVLKTLGFTRAGLLGLIVGEAGLVALLAGLAGAGGAWLMTAAAPVNFSLGIVSRFVVSGRVAALSVGVALLIGLLSGFWPAWRAARLTIVETLRRLN